MISLVIPADNEERYLPRLLDSVDVARRRYEAQGGALEVIVADNGSTDGTARVAAERGCRVVPVAPRNIGAVRNGGARAARGDIVAWVDADHRIHPDTFVVVKALLADPRVVGGTSGATMERWSFGIRVTYTVLVVASWVAGIDTGVVFCRTADFTACGGYDERYRAAEDVMFLLALKRLGRPRGQRVVRARGIKVVWSTRKFDQYGNWHYFRLLLPGLRLLLGPPKLGGFLERYWYGPGR